ncbi:MAG: zinc-binding dehydrogenase [Nitrospirae bacterium]|nr:zinc-binding dehydrogenase [Nitrospirota bacterium]
MKAIQVTRTGPPEVLEYADVECPSPGEGQVLVKVVSASVNYADTMMRRGVYPRMPSLPTIAGLECSGVVESVGKGVTHVRAGQSVVVLDNQCYAEYVVAAAASVTSIPDDLDKDEASAIHGNYMTAYHMLHTVAHVEAGQTVLVYAAAGGVGTAIIQLAKLAGAKVIGLTRSEDKAAFARKQGADHVINYTTEDVSQSVKYFTGNRGADLILNSVAGDTFKRDFEVLAPLGQITWLGFAGGLPQLNLTELLGEHFMGSKGIRAFSIYTIFETYPDLWAQSLKSVIQLLTEKKIRTPIQERIPLSEAARAHRLMESGVVQGKIVLKP